MQQVCTKTGWYHAICLAVLSVLCGFWFAVEIAFAAKPTTEGQLVAMIALVCWLVALLASFIYALSRWQTARWWAAVPLLLCLGSCEVAPRIGGAVRQSRFQNSLPRREALVAKIESGALPCSAELKAVALQESDRDLGYLVLAQRESNGFVTVEFFDGGGFPVKHSGYLYKSSGVVDPDSTSALRWPRRSPICPKWFRVSD